MPSRFELIGKTNATIKSIDILSLKMGQTDVQPAVCITFKVPLPNSKLSMLDGALQRFLYEKDGPQSPNTNTLAGIEPVSDLPDLTAAAKAIGSLSWDYEQTGCKLRIYNGASGHADIKLKDGTVRKMKIDPQQGGTVDHYFEFYTADVDAETMGEIGILKSLERDIELTAPEIISAQKNLPGVESKGSAPVTPEKALADQVRKDAAAGASENPFPPADVKSDVKVTTKAPRAAAAKAAANKPQVKRRA